MLTPAEFEDLLKDSKLAMESADKYLRSELQRLKKKKKRNQLKSGSYGWFSSLYAN